MATSTTVGQKRARTSTGDEGDNTSLANSCSSAERCAQRVSKQVEDVLSTTPPPTLLTQYSNARVDTGRSSVNTGYVIQENAAITFQKLWYKSVDVLILFDVSPSMHSVQPILEDCVRKLPDMLSNGSTVANVNCALGFFGDEVEIMHTGQVTGYDRFGTLSKVVALNLANRLSINRSGGTNTSLALEKGLSALKENRNDCNRDNGYLQHLVLVTDGNPTRGKTIAKELGHIVDHHVDVEQQHCSVMVHVLSIGDDVSVQVPHEIVKSTCGLIGHARSADDLLPEMKRIFDPITSSTMAFSLAISDNRTDTVRYKRFGLLTPENRSALFSLDFPPVECAGMHQAASITLANSGPFFPEQLIMIEYFEKDEYEQASSDTMPVMLQQMLDEKRMQDEEQQEVRNALAANNFEGAIEISRTYTQNYNNQNLDSARRRSAARTARLEQMANFAANTPPMDSNSATMTTMSLASQSFY